MKIAFDIDDTMIIPMKQKIKDREIFTKSIILTTKLVPVIIIILFGIPYIIINYILN